MANEEHLKIIKQGVSVWNDWRKVNEIIRPDLSGADLSGMDLKEVNLGGDDPVLVTLFEAHLIKGEYLSGGANLSRTNFSRADLSKANLNRAHLFEANLSGANLFDAKFNGANLGNANLSEADFSRAALIKAILCDANLNRANLRGANLSEANLIGADFSEANLIGVDFSEANFIKANLIKAILCDANLSKANFSGADLNGADLSRADLRYSIFVNTDLTNANLSNCSIYGISAWDLILEKTKQKDLVITPEDSPVISVDNLEVAQFIYLLLRNEKIRDIIDTIAKKVVLILGRFTKERKKILDAIRDELRKKNYSPILFDFEIPTSRDITETIRILAHLSRFVIADLTDARSVPQELEAIIPNLPSVAFQPILETEKDEYGMFEHYKRYPWVLPVCHYEDIKDLENIFEGRIVKPAEKKVLELKKQ